MTKYIGEIARKYRQSHKGVMTKRYLEMKAESKRRELEIMNRQYFNIWCMELSDFGKVFYTWYESGYKKSLSPVIEKIDKTKGFVADNLRWVTQKEKNRSNGRSTKVFDGDKRMEFGSARKAELKLNLPRGVLSRALRTNGRYKNLRVYKSL